MRRPERLLTPDDIAVAVWPTGTSPHPSTVVACVGAMRRKLETHGESRLVHTVRGAGYVLEEDVSPGPHPRPIELERRGRDYGRIS